jgi:hypothetical protein
VLNIAASQPDAQSQISLTTPSQTGPSCDDPFNDREVRTYLRDLTSVSGKRVGLPRDSKPNKDVGEAPATRLHQKKVELQKRNRRAADSDISDKYQINFINDKNKRFNKRLNRAYNESTEDLRLNL